MRPLMDLLPLLLLFKSHCCCRVEAHPSLSSLSLCISRSLSTQVPPSVSLNVTTVILQQSALRLMPMNTLTSNGKGIKQHGTFYNMKGCIKFHENVTCLEFYFV